MRLEDSVTNLAISQEMDRVGLEKGGTWWWVFDTEKWSLKQMKDISNEPCAEAHVENVSAVSARTCAEMMNILPKETYICQKALWYKDKKIDIDHVDHSLDKPLNYANAMGKMATWLRKEKLI